MSETKQELSLKLAQARLQLEEVQARITDLEAALFEGQLDHDTVQIGHDDHHLAFQAPEMAKQTASEIAINRYAQRMEILHQIDLGILSAYSIQEIVELALKHIRVLFDCQQAGVILTDYSTNEIVIFATDTSSPFPQQASNDLMRKEMVIIDDLQAMPEIVPNYQNAQKEGMRSSLHAPLMFQDEHIGLLVLNADKPHFFTAELQEIATEIANQLAIAIKQMHLSEALAHHSSELEQKIMQRTADLSAAKERVEAILNNSTDGILLVHSDLTIQQANSSFNDLFACAPEEYYGKSVVALVQPEDSELVTKTLRGVFADAKGQSIETRAVRKDSSMFDAELSIGLIKGDGLVCTIRDITTRKAQERQLRFNASVQQNLSDAVISTDLQFVIQSWNRAAEFIYGWRADEAIGKTIDGLLQAQLDTSGGRPSVRAHFLKVGYWTGDVEQVRKDGSKLFMRGSVTRLDDENNVPYGFTSVFRDVTTLRAQEQQLKYQASLQENVSDAVIVTDAEFRIQSWNKAAERIYGWRADEVMHTIATDILPIYDSADQPQSAGAIRQLYEQGWWQGEVIQHRKDGSIVHILGSVSLIKDEHDAPSAVISVSHDITESKLAAEAIQKSAAEIHDLYNNAPCGYHSIDKDGMIIQINDTELRWLGYTRDEVVGKLHINDLFSPDSQLEFQKNFALFKEQGRVSDLEYNVVRKDGSLMRILLNAVAIYDEQGQYLSSRSSVFDTTELRQTQLALVENEMRYRLLAENISDVIAKSNLDGMLTFITPSCYHLTGYMPQELIGLGNVEIVHPDERLEFQAVMQRELSASKTSFTRIQRISHKSDAYIWVEMTINIVRDPNTGKPVEAIAVMRDFTERKRIEDALNARLVEEREFQSHLKALHEITIELTQIDTLDTFYRRAVELGQERLGFERLALFLFQERDGSAVGTYGTNTEGSVVGEHALRFVPDPNGIMKRAFERTERFCFDEETTLFANEVPVGIGWNAATVLWNGTESLGWLIVDNLLTHQPATKVMLDTLGLYALTLGTLLAQKQAQYALKESEEKYRTLIETMHGGIVIFDADYKITYVNDQFCQFVGYTREEAIGMRPSDFVDTNELPTVETQVERRRLMESSTYEIALRHKDGRYVHLLIAGSPLPSKNGEYIGSVAVSTDITPQKQAEARLRQAFEKEKEIGELKSRFVTIASHEFRTPLATILALTETLSNYRDRMTDALIEQRLSKIRDQVGHLKDIMDDVLQLGKMQANRLEVKPAELDLDALCREIIGEFRERTELGLQLLYTCENTPPVLSLDKKLIRQVVSNLISNAIKYSPTGKSVKIHLSQIGETVVLSVQDEGIGIPDADLSHLFEPFHRASNVGAIRGTGLGLTITKESVELHGGTIAVESQLGKGTKFTVRLPLTAGG